MTTSPSAAPGPQVRQVVRDLPAYVPGRPPAPRPGVTTYKLSSNENPHDPLPGVLEAAVEAAGRMNRYPDMGCTELYAALADRLDVPATPPRRGHRVGRGALPPAAGVLRARRRGRLRLALLRGLPDRGRGPRRGLRAGPADRRRPARPRRDGRGGHRPHQGRDRLQPEQPHRPVRPPRRARGVPRPGAGARRGGARRGLPRVRPRPGPLRRGRRLPLAAQRGGDAHLRQGLRPGRLPGRVRRRGRADRGRRPRLRPAVRRLVGRAGRGRRVAGPRGRAARAGRGASSPSAPGWPTALREQGWDGPGRAGQLRLAAARRPGHRLRRRRRAAPG